MNILGIIASQSSGPAGGLPVAGASLWLDSNDSSTFSFSSGTRVSEWRDKSGNARHFTQTTTGSQPDRSASQGGKTGVYFDRSAANYFMSNSSYSWAASAFTAFFVADPKGGDYTALLSRNSTGALQIGYGQGAGTYAISRIGQATSNSNLAPTVGNADVVCYRSAGISSGTVNVDVFKNGTAGSATLTLGSLGAGDKALLGASSDGAADTFGTDGYICEVLVYPSQLSVSDRNTVESYLKTKWGTP